MRKRRMYCDGFKRYNKERNRYFVDARDENARKNIRTMKKICLFLLVFQPFLFLITPLIVPTFVLTVHYWYPLPVMVFFIIFSLCYSQQAKINPLVVDISCAFFLAALLAYGIIIDIFPNPKAPSSFTPLFLTIFPIMYIMRYRVLLPILLVSEMIYVCLCANVKAPAMAANDIFNSLIGLVFGFVVAYVTVQLRIQDNNAKREYKRRCMIDSLTGILNKTSCESCIREAIKTRETVERYALILVDIDNLKRINDQFGNLIGDVFLEDFAEELTEMFRGRDVIGRVGGDEFMVYVRNMDAEEWLAAKCRKIQETVKALAHEQGNIRMTCSIGAAISGAKNKDFDSIYRVADDSLYEAKTLGRGRLVVHHMQDTNTLTEERFWHIIGDKCLE